MNTIPHCLCAYLGGRKYAEYDPDTNKINVYGGKVTYYRLASSLFHEYFHSFQYNYLNGAIVNYFTNKYNGYPLTNYLGIESKSKAAIEAQAYSYQINHLGDNSSFIISEYNSRAKRLNWPIYGN